MGHKVFNVLAALCLAAVAVAPAEAGNSSAGAVAKINRTACVGTPYSYAGIENAGTAHGVSATIAETAKPAVENGHIAAWIGLGGLHAGPGDVPEWLQVGFIAFDGDSSAQIYYEIADSPKAYYHQVKANVQPGESHHFAVLEMAGRSSWWRVWMDGKPVSPPIHLPGSHGTWKPQAMGENQTGTGTCNGYAYEFSNLEVADANGGGWQPFDPGYTFQDPGYRVVRTQPVRFLATSD